MSPEHKYHPWNYLRSLSEWRLDWVRHPDGLCAITDYTTHTITLDPRLTQAQRRSTITHELVHIERGPVPADPILAAREEAAVEAEAARRLISINALVDALKWAHNLAELADELWVDQTLLITRLSMLNTNEIAELEKHGINVSR